MNCESYKKWLDELVEDALDQQKADQVSLHLADCEICTNYFEMLEREKFVYARYLFEIEPPVYLSESFENKLKTYQSSLPAGKIFFIPKIWSFDVLGFLRSHRALSMAAVAILLGAVLSLTNIFRKTAEPERAEKVYPVSQPVLGEVPKVAGNPANGKFGSESGNAEPVRFTKGKPERFLKPQQINHREPVKKLQAKPEPVTKRPIIEEQTQAHLKIIRELESETVKQIEKTESLLRSFRNARLIEGSEIYDIAYEKQQARKLLQKNIILREKAELYGNLFAEETLSKVEPFLLDIANLDIDSAPDQILEIKQRVRNQNIIASLQGY